jgi:two-component system sensor histidine kinase DesK
MTPNRLPAWLRPAPGSLVANALQRGKSPWVDVVPVLWSAWVFITPQFMPQGYDMRWIVLTLLSYPLFLLLYAKTLLAPPRTAHRYALGMIALSLALLPWYPSGMSYFVFGCVMLHLQRVRSILAHAGVLLALNLVFVGYALWIGYPRQAIVWMPLVSLIIGIIVRVERINQEKDAALRLSHDEVRRLAATAERERIGRDLHDLLGHTLSLVALKSDLAGKLIAREPEAAQREIGEVSRVAREALSQVRAAVTGIRAAGMAAELASAKLLLECEGVAFRYVVDDQSLDGSALPPRVETALAMTVREAVTNIQRHARAQNAEVAFATDGGEAVLRIVDDGRGGAIVPGNGLGGMRERIEALGGQLRVDSGSDRGTRIEARVPLAANDDAGAPDDASARPL